MMDEQFVITISHVLGSGGAYIGKRLSEIFKVPFVDRQILKMVSEKLSISENDIELLDEKKSSFWQSFSRLELMNEPVIALTADYIPSDRDLFDLESEFIKQIANKSSAIILGRGGRYILRDHPRHLSIFVYADMKDRIKRVSELYNISENASAKMIEKNDKDRKNYIQSFTKLKLTDAKAYDICINTSSIGLENAVGIVKNCFDLKYS